MEAGGKQDTILMVLSMVALPLAVWLQVGWRRRCEVQDCLRFLLYTQRYFRHMGITFQLLLRTQPSGLLPDTHTHTHIACSLCTTHSPHLCTILQAEQLPS